MSYLLNRLLILASLLVMAGCGLQYVKYPDVADYPYRHADFDYKYAWKTVPETDGIKLEGVMKNVRYAFINSVSLKVELLDKTGRTLSRESDFPMPQQTREGDFSRFSLLLKNAKPAAGDIFRFTVQYKANEGGDDEGGSGIDWVSIFKVDALTGAGIGEGKPAERW